MNVSLSMRKDPVILRALILAALLLLLQIPIMKIAELVAERAQAKTEALSEVSRVIGGRQSLAGPVLVVDYGTVRTSESGERKFGPPFNSAFLLPEDLLISAETKHELRHRGIYALPTYAGQIRFKGNFQPSLIQANDTLKSLQAMRAKLFVGISEPKVLRKSVQLKIGDTSIPFEPGVSEQEVATAGIQAKVPLELITSQAPIEYEFQLEISGSDGLEFYPFGRNNEVSVSADWQDPSFEGPFLPVSKQYSPEGFKANWQVSDLGLGVARLHVANMDKVAQLFGNSAFGVRFLPGIDAHRMSERALKYQLLFLFLTFLAFFMFDLFSDSTLHIVHYLLIGCTLTVFYLLLLSLSEHIGFQVAYALASAVPIALIGFYSRSILRLARLRWLIPMALSTLYLCLFSLLMEEDYALLIGSSALTLVLAVVMYVTRNVDWRAVGRAPTQAVGGSHQPPLNEGVSI